MSDDRFELQAADTAVAELVAYLDGELDVEASREVEGRLSKDAEYRHKLHQLQQSWDMLDHLPTADVDQTFTQTTVAMVAVTASGEVEQQQVAVRQRYKLRGILAGLAAVAAFVIGYLGIALWTSRDERQLLKDLPVIERIDEYRYAENVEFLRMLEQEGLFAETEVQNGT